LSNKQATHFPLHSGIPPVLLLNLSFHFLFINKITGGKGKRFVSLVKMFLTAGRLPLTVGNPTVVCHLFFLKITLQKYTGKKRRYYF
jgi:hypothetical protein